MAILQEPEIPVQQAAGFLITETFAIGRIADKYPAGIGKLNFLERKHFCLYTAGHFSLADMPM